MTERLAAQQCREDKRAAGSSRSRPTTPAAARTGPGPDEAGQRDEPVPVRHRPEPDQEHEHHRIGDHGVGHREEPGRAVRLYRPKTPAWPWAPSRETVASPTLLWCRLRDRAWPPHRTRCQSLSSGRAGNGSRSSPSQGLPVGQQQTGPSNEGSPFILDAEARRVDDRAERYRAGPTFLRAEHPPTGSTVSWWGRQRVLRLS